MPTATDTCLRDLGHAAGRDAALQRAMQMVAGAAFGALVGLLGPQALVAMVAAMTISALLSVVLLSALHRAARGNATSVTASRYG